MRLSPHRNAYEECLLLQLQVQVRTHCTLFSVIHTPWPSTTRPCSCSNCVTRGSHPCPQYPAQSPALAQEAPAQPNHFMWGCWSSSHPCQNQEACQREEEARALMEGSSRNYGGDSGNESDNPSLLNPGLADTRRLSVAPASGAELPNQRSQDTLVPCN